VGFALYFFTYSTFLARPTLYVEDLFVLPEQRGKGAGKALLAALARIAVRRGCGRMEWVVLGENAPAIRFYRRLGASLRKEWILTRLTDVPLRRLARGRLPDTMADADQTDPFPKSHALERLIGFNFRVTSPGRTYQ